MDHPGKHFLSMGHLQPFPLAEFKPFGAVGHDIENVIETILDNILINCGGDIVFKYFEFRDIS